VLLHYRTFQKLSYILLSCPLLFVYNEVTQSVVTRQSPEYRYVANLRYVRRLHCTHLLNFLIASCLVLRSNTLSKVCISHSLRTVRQPFICQIPVRFWLILRFIILLVFLDFLVLVNTVSLNVGERM